MIHSDVTISNVPLPIEGGNPTAVKVDGSAVTQPVSGSVSVSGSVTVGNFPATQPVSGTVSVISAMSSSASVAAVSQSTSVDTVLLAANANRKSAIIFLPKSGTAIKYGSGASASSFTYKTTSTNTAVTVSGYTGQINSFGPADTINVTELL